MAILSGFLVVIFVLSGILLVIIVLMQDEQGEGLGGIFGGGGAAPVGNRSGNILTRATEIIATVFLVTLFGYAWINRTPDASNVEAQARQLEAEAGGTLQWWLVDEPVEVSEDILPEAPATVETESEGEGESESDSSESE